MKLSESVKQAIFASVIGFVMIGGTFSACAAVIDREPERTTITTTVKHITIEHTAATPPATEESSASPDDILPNFSETAEVIYAIPRLASEEDIELIARVIWGEAGYIPCIAEQAAVAWCILNRVDEYEKFSIEQIIKSPYQFYYEMGAGKPVPERYISLARDVVERWEREHAGEEDVGRVLPAEYQFYVGDGEHNHFTAEWLGTEYWDWSLPSPYEEDM